MADKGRSVIRRKEKKENESAELKKEVKNGGKKDQAEASSAEEVASDGACQNGDFQVEPMELPPFEIITGYVLFTCVLENGEQYICSGQSLTLTNSYWHSDNSATMLYVCKYD